MMAQQSPTLATPIESMPWLDQLTGPLKQASDKVFQASGATQKFKDWLNGTPVRHRLHPMFVTVPLGAWTTAAVLDLLDMLSSGEDYAAGADAAVALGLAGAVPSALSGLADWVDLEGQPQRIGMAHATLNTLALGLYGASYVLRRGGQRGLARVLAATGFGMVTLSGALGGELVYNLGANVTYQLHPILSADYTDVLASAELPEGKPVVVEVEQVPVLLLRHAGHLHAVENTCPHLGAPLNEGTIEGEVLTCPWHGSQFCLGDGQPLRGPASAPLRTFEAKEESGRILLRPSDAA
jgi:nitrite reductase/ring-hydroxylating ferredoxin subunit/uncharacterized membrane protein